MFRIVLSLTLFFGVNAFAQTEVFKIRPAFILSYDCPTKGTLEGCADEVIIPGLLDVELVNGEGSWNNTYVFNGYPLYAFIDVSKDGGDYDVFAYLMVGDVGGAGEYADGYFSAGTPSDKALNRISTRTGFTEKNGKFAMGFIMVESSATPARTFADLRKFAASLPILRR